MVHSVNGWAPTPEESWQLFAAAGDVVQVAAGEYHSLALKADGTVWAWGDNWYGQLGDANKLHKLTPAQVAGLTDIVYIAAGYYHSLAVKSDGTVWAWGINEYGQLGDGSITDKSTPVQVNGITGIASVAAGDSHSLALNTDGDVWAWGGNWFGQLGEESLCDFSIPVQVNDLYSVISIAAGQYHSLAVISEGSTWAWGNNWYSQTTDDWGIAYTATPIQMSWFRNSKAVAAGQYHSLALRTGGTVWFWGDSLDPTKENGLREVEFIEAGDFHSLAVLYDGTVWGWGDNSYGQLGNNINWWFDYPVQIIGVTDIISVATGLGHTLAVKSDGSIWAWGYNNLGQLGDGSTIDRTTPVQVGIAQALQEPDLVIDAATGKEYLISVSAEDITTFSNVSFTLTYDANVFNVEDLCAFTKTKETVAGLISQAGVTIVSVAPGEIIFSVSKQVPQGKMWSGCLNVFRLKAKATAITELGIS